MGLHLPFTPLSFESLLCRTSKDSGVRLNYYAKISTPLLPLASCCSEVGTGSASLAATLPVPLNAAQLAALPCDEPDCWPDCWKPCCACCHCEVSLLTLLWLRLIPLSASDVRSCGIAASNAARTPLWPETKFICA